MEELQTDILSDYGKNQPQENTDLDSSRENENGCAASLLNGCEEIDDPLDLMADHCDNVSIASNSDIWKGSDSEDENFEKKDSSTENVETNKKNDTNADNTPVMNKQIDFEEEIDKVVTNRYNSITKVDTEQPNEKVAQDESQSDKPEELKNNVNKSVKENSSGNADETEKKDEENVGDSSVIESKTEHLQKTDDQVEKDQKDDNDEGKKQNKEKTICSSKESQNVEAAVNGEEKTAIESTEKNSSDDTALSTQPPAEETDGHDLSTNEDNNLSDLKPSNKNTDDQDDDCQMEYDADDDDDFDPSLLCPEVSMAVDDDPLVTTNGPVPDDTGPDSPLPYEPVFSTFVDEVTGAEISFNLTAEEQELRKRIYGPTNPVQLTRIHCTACNVHLGSALEGQNNRFVHPLLKVLICKECYHFYTSGEFEKDEDGSELYCRWCGQGGQVLCCSKCEFVFCKRCIRTNFGRKKMFEIRDSDCWDCFRCNQSQIITQRIACYEFFEYIRREMSRAATLNTSEIWSKDHSRCCIAKKRSAEDGEEVKKPKRRKEVDPDYNPISDKRETSPAIVVPSTSAANAAALVSKGITIPKPIQIVPKYTLNNVKDNDIEFVRQIPAPRVTINPSVRPTYRTILPSHVRPVLQAAPTLVRISSQPVPSLVPTTSSRILGSALQNRNVNSSLMKHEWFEKTVRAAARVNSHLSYTLTQLNKAQSQAASVEELAVVHNKLQEILSSSINSLIQIRKNLRTEFIAGIKTVRLPSKKIETGSDDDVIFVSAPETMPMPSTSQIKTPVDDPLIIIDKSDSFPRISSDFGKSTVGTERPKGYLKVKSVMELQNVPSECITIPDDPPSSEEKAEKEKESTGSDDVVCNGDSADSTAQIKDEYKESDPLVISNKEDSNENPVTKTDLSEVPNLNENSLNKETESIEPTESDLSSSEVEKIKPRKSRNTNITYNVKDDPTVDFKRMTSVKVHLQRDNLEELQKTLASKPE